MLSRNKPRLQILSFAVNIKSNLIFCISVISGFHDMPSLLTFWTKCSTPVHMYHISADKMVKHLHETFSQTGNTESPGLDDTGMKVSVVTFSMNLCMYTFILSVLVVSDHAQSGGSSIKQEQVGTQDP